MKLRIRKFYPLFALFVGLMLGVGLMAHGLQAQNPALTPQQITVSNPCIGNMNVSVAGKANYCFGNDGFFESVNAGPITQIAPLGNSGVVAGSYTNANITVNAQGILTAASNGSASSGGVSSFNGRTGAVVSAANDYSFAQISGVASASQVPAPPVSSVNGKTGAVVLGATTTVQPPPLSVSSGNLVVGAPSASTSVQ